MKFYMLPAMALIGWIGVNAQDANIKPSVIEEVSAKVVSPDGKYFMAQDLTGSTYVYEVNTLVSSFYSAYYPGNGNMLANNGMAVGQDMESSLGAIMMDGQAKVPVSLRNTSLSSLNAITPDGTRACGWMADFSGGPLYVPFYCDITASGSAGKPIALPIPKKDFFGTTPQYITADWISDDGKRIAGTVHEATGFFTYPIAFIQDADGNWTYTQPTESLFNPDKLPLPVAPDDDEAGDALDEYHRDLERLGRDSNFGGNVILSPDGKYLLCSKLVSNAEELTDVVDGFIPYCFDLDDGTITKLGSRYSNLLPTQMLPDGTIVAVSAPSDFIPWTSYVMLPGEEEFIPFTEYISITNSDFLAWIEDNLGQYGIVGYDPVTGEPISEFYVITGLVSLSNNKDVIVSGLPIGDMETYIFTDASAAVEEIASELPVEYKVYNINGINVLNTKEEGDLYALPEGIYIVNGKKIKI